MSTTSLEDKQQQISFQYANECDLEIHCSPFGLSGLYIKIDGTNLMGIGSTMGLITGSTKGHLHYNDSNDLIDQKYKLYVIVDEDDMLRIDFAKIFTLEKDKSGETKKDKTEVKTESDSGSGSGPALDGEYNLDVNIKKEKNDNESVQKEEEYDKYEEEEVPTLIFRGKCPEGRPDNVEPFIGIFSFEREN